MDVKCAGNMPACKSSCCKCHGRAGERESGRAPDFSAETQKAAVIQRGWGALQELAGLDSWHS